MNFILWLDMPDDGTLDPQDALDEAVASIARNDELVWDLKNDDGTVFAENVRLRGEDERALRQLMKDIETHGDEHLSLERRAAFGGEALMRLRRWEEDNDGKTFDSRQAAFLIFTKLLGMREEQAMKMSGLDDPDLYDAKPDWVVSVEFKVGGDTKAEAVEHVSKLIRDAGYSHVAEVR